MKYRGSVWTLGFWLKLTLSCGLYIFWWWNDYIIVTSTYVAKVWGIPNKKRVIPRNKIRAIKQNVNVLGKMFHYADIEIHSMDTGAIYFHGLHDGNHLVEQLA